MNANLLPELDERQEDLLPVGTRVFPTTLRLRAQFYYTLLALVVGAPMIFGIAGSVRDSGGAQIVVLLGVIWTAGCLLALVLMRLADGRAYARRVQAGSWHYGVVVFPGGDVVVRDTLPWGRTELHVESMYLARADCRVARTWGSLFLPRLHLVIRKSDLDGNAAEYLFPDAAFSDSPQQIVECIRSIRAGDGGGGGAARNAAVTPSL